MKTYQLYQVDSFTTEKFKGNPAGVVINADGLSEQQMLSIARELNNSETAFVFSPQGSDHDLYIRYFTPTVEVPICGHATIATHYVRAMINNAVSSKVLHKVGIGILPVEIIKDENGYLIMMKQGEIQFSEPFIGQEHDNIVTALGLNQEDLDQRCPIQIVSTGHSKVMIGIKSRKKLDSLVPDMISLSRLSRLIGCNGYFVFTLDSEISGVLTHGRMFAPAIGIDEDPVTGNANGPLGAYLVKHDLVKYSEGSFAFKGEQGTAIGRSGIVEVQVKIEKGEPVEAQIGGRAVIVFQTSIEL
ncbi:PhzF family isomerase [Sporomusa malonica]|uniref:Phenazine biosynthesis protein PhzF family n=1 Tax=Sporomusa malonica TaxID=112901 RepID=A0A1W2CZ68_9FIRM|nr:PhzF family isomerase [Sporomusa malonica]SMC90236.1 phenazine biosynthesis protein PhzF family [Sporomusa malonica]